MTNTSPHHKRRIVLVDHAIQRSLLIALVILEASVAAIAIWTLYKTLGAIVDANMYRIHITAKVDLLSELFKECIRVLGYMLGINLLALIVADRIWALYVNGILRNLKQLMTLSLHLDFSAQKPVALNHMVLEQATAWRQSASLQLVKSRDCIRNLPVQLPELPQDQEATRAALSSLS